MAETFIAVRRGPGGFEQHLCIKRILPSLEADDGFIRLFMREARVSARLHHSNIAQVVDFGVVDGSHFLALELIRGIDLRALITALSRQNDRIDPGLVVHIAFELASALDFAHAANESSVPLGIVHRDISASNVLLSRAGEVKLTDFGIAKAMNNPETIQSGTIKGKVPYMAPEYASGSDFDARSDLFSLGVVLYECLAGRRPFDGTSFVETLKLIADSEFEPLQEVVPDAPAPFVRLVEQCLAAVPAERPANAGQFLDLLSGIVPPPTARRELGMLVREHCIEEGSSRESTEETLSVSPGGTVALPGDRIPSTDPRIEAGSPEQKTRTSFHPPAEEDKDAS